MEPIYTHFPSRRDPIDHATLSSDAEPDVVGRNSRRASGVGPAHGPPSQSAASIFAAPLDATRGSAEAAGKAPAWPAALHSWRRPIRRLRRWCGAVGRTPSGVRSTFGRSCCIAGFGIGRTRTLWRRSCGTRNRLSRPWIPARRPTVLPWESARQLWAISSLPDACFFFCFFLHIDRVTCLFLCDEPLTQNRHARRLMYAHPSLLAHY